MPAGAEVERGATITLTVGDIAGQVVPDVTGLAAEEAGTVLVDSHLEDVEGA